MTVKSQGDRFSPSGCGRRLKIAEGGGVRGQQGRCSVEDCGLRGCDGVNHIHPVEERKGEQ